MKLEKKEYTIDGSDIKINIWDIWEDNTEYYMVNAVIKHRRLNIWYEAGDYKLYKHLITNWKEV